MKKKVFIFLFDGFSDWEIAYMTPELQKNEMVELVYCSIGNKVITSMGGLNVNPHMRIDEVDASVIDMLILPGGVYWENEVNQQVEELIQTLLTSGKTVGAICAATTILGKLGYLDKVNHTSNDLDYLKNIAPQYQGEASYQHKLAVTDKNIITASGIAPIEFAREIFIQLDSFDRKYVENWFQLFKNGVWAA